jgi:8-oxo-dGTP pyrophosphatase MutT (NUDIX family)
MEVRTYRPAVRVVCVDADGRVLLLQWRDPLTGELLWEPPGGGIEPGESPIDTARRELREETGLDPDAIDQRYISVDRDVCWNGKRFVGPEEFFLARYAAAEPPLVPGGLLPDEQHNLVRTRWVPWREFPTLERLEPPGLLEVLARLDPAGAWASPA